MVQYKLYLGYNKNIILRYVITHYYKMVEAGSIYAIGSGVAALAGSPASSLLADWLSSWWQKRRLRSRVRGLILVKGVTTMCQKLSNSDFVYIDCDSIWQTLNAPKDAESHAKNPDEINPVDAMISYSIIKNHIVNITNVFKGKIILVSKCHDLLRALPVKNENTYFAVFSKEMEQNITLIYSSEKEHQEAQVNKFRVMRAIPEERVYIVESLKDLYDKTAEKFGSKMVSL